MKQTNEIEGNVFEEKQAIFYKKMKCINVFVQKNVTEVKLCTTLKAAKYIVSKEKIKQSIKVVN